MLRRAVLLGTVVAIALATLPAAAQPMDALGTKTGRINPGAFLEQNLQLNGGQRIAWTMSWQPSGERAFYDIHSHPDNRVVEYDNGTVQGGASGTFVVPATGVYSWLVENKASSRPLDATITTATSGAAPASGIPAPAAAMVGAALAAAAWAARPRR